MGLGDSGGRGSKTQMLLCRTWTEVRAPGLLGAQWGAGCTTRKRWKHREEAPPAPPVTVGILANRMRMGQGLPLCSTPPPTSAGRAAPFQALCPQGPGCGHQGWTSPDVDNSATPVPGLHSHKPNTPYGLGPSQAPTPQLTGPQLPCCIRLLSACTHPRACYTTVVRAQGTHAPRVA